MRETIISNLKARFAAYDDLIATTAEVDLPTTIAAPRHKSISDHLWCIVGARESYALAIREGNWLGFKCSIQVRSQEVFARKLVESAQTVLSTIESVKQWTSGRDELLAALSEHEVMHEGQIIRHVFATTGALPTSWKWA